MTKQRDTFCPAPWMTFYLEPNGKVDLCCIGSADLGNVHDQSLKDILQSNKIIEIKQLMLENKPVPACEACHAGYDSSLQNRFLKRFGNRHHPDYQNINNFKLKYLDLRWNNTCNYACLYCGPELSSLWAQINDTKQIKITSMRTDLVDLVLDDIENLKEVYLAGGEPLMLKENLSILTRLAEINLDCKITVNTNLSNIQNNEIFDKILSFKNVQWMISAETLGPEYEYLRWPGKWSTFDQNLKTLKSVSKSNHTIAFNMVWLNLNGLSIWDYIDYLAHLDLDITGVSIIPYNMDVWDGPWHLKHMPKEFLIKIRDRMSDSKYHGIFTYQQNLQFIEKHINDANHTTNIETIVDRLEHYDNARNTDYKQTFPHFYSLTKS